MPSIVGTIAYGWMNSADDRLEGWFAYFVSVCPDDKMKICICNVSLLHKGSPCPVRRCPTSAEIDRPGQTWTDWGRLRHERRRRPPRAALSAISTPSVIQSGQLPSTLGVTGFGSNVLVHPSLASCPSCARWGASCPSCARWGRFSRYRRPSPWQTSVAVRPVTSVSRA